GPSARTAAAMVFDSTRQVVVMFGGNTSDSSSETWEWDGTTWTRPSYGGPTRRSSHAMAYDSGRQTIVLYGGYTGFSRPPAETWELADRCVSPRIVEQPIDQFVGVDTPVAFVVEATPGLDCASPEALTYQWQRRNPIVADPSAAGAWIDLTDGGGFFHTRSAALLIARPTPGLATGYRCIIGAGCVCRSGHTAFTVTELVNFSVSCPADFNADGGVDFGDVESFFERWENGC
ncbi:MAG: hypothetical protein WCK33_12875, partial [Phycisphaerae bacterium]